MQTRRETKKITSMACRMQFSQYTACKSYREEAKNEDRTRQNTAKGTITTLCLNYVDIHVKYFMIFNHTIYFPYFYSTIFFCSYSVWPTKLICRNEKEKYDFFFCQSHFWYWLRNTNTVDK